MSTPNTGIPYVPEGTLDPAAGLNAALNWIDALLQPGVISMALSSPPGSPANGDMYVVNATGTGAWTGLDNNLVRYVSEGTFWQSYIAGTQVRIILNQDDGLLYIYNPDSPTAGWTVLTGGGGGGGTFSEVVAQTGTALVAGAADSNRYTRFTNAAAKTYEFDGSEAYVIGDEFHGRNVGAADLTITESNGMTVNPPAGGSLVIPQGGTFTVKIVDTDEADLIGVTEAP